MPVLTKEYIAQYRLLQKSVRKFDNTIASRVNEILQYIHKSAGIKLRNWYFYDAEEGTRGQLIRHGRDFKYVYVVKDCRGGEYLIALDGGIIDLIESFPASWLFDNSYKNIIKAGREKVVEAENRTKARELEAENNRKKILKKAKKNLTKEEREVLRLYLERNE